MPSRPLPPVPWGLLALVVAALVFFPGLSGGFFLDDYSSIVDNTRIHAQSIDVASLVRAIDGFHASVLGRPIATVSFALDHALWGLEPFGYKFTNLAIHVFNAWLVLVLLRRLLAERFEGRHVATVAALGMLAWATHPLQVSTVLYVVQRMEMLAASFVLLALLAWLAGRRRQIAGGPGLPWLAGSVALAATGFLAKESAVAFFPLVLALEFGLLHFRAADPGVRRHLRRGLAIAAVVAVVAFFGWALPRLAPAESFAIRDFSQWERVLTQARVLPLYLGQILLPLPDAMPVYYDNFPKSTGLFAPWTTMAGLALVMALLAVAWRLRRAASLVSLGILWFFGAHALTSSPLNLELVFEHRNYLALLGIVIAAIDAIARIPMRDGPALKVFAAVVVLAAFGTLATIRAATWGDPLVLATDLATRNPGSVRASNDLGTIYVNYSGGDPASPFLQFAIDEFKRSAALPRSGPFPEQALILVSTMGQRPIDPAWWDTLTEKLRTQPIGPEHVMAVTGMLEQHQAGFEVDPERLAEVFQTMLDRRPTWAGHVLANFADFVHDDLGDEPRATRLYVRAVTDNPTDSEFPQQLLATLIQQGRGPQAQAVANAMARLGMIAESPSPRASTEP